MVQLNDVGMNGLLESHLIGAETLRTDNFDAFYLARNAKLLALIERVMGKQILTPLASDDRADEEEEELTTTE